MNINLHIEAESPEEFKAILASLAAGPNPTTDQTAPAARKKSTKTKQEKLTEKEEKPAMEDPAPTEAPPAEKDAPSNADIPSVVDLRAVAAEIGKTPDGKIAIRDLLHKYKSRSISNVPEDKRVDFLADLEAL